MTITRNEYDSLRPLIETIMGDSVTPWAWVGYTPDASRKPD